MKEIKTKEELGTDPVEKFRISTVRVPTYATVPTYLLPSVPTISIPLCTFYTLLDCSVCTVPVPYHQGSGSGPFLAGFGKSEF